MGYKDLNYLADLNFKERELDEIQENINRARKKYFDVSEIQLKLDRRQAELDKTRKLIIDAKGDVVNPN